MKISKILETNIIKLYCLVVSQNRREMCLIQHYCLSQYNKLIFILKIFLEIYITNRLYSKGSSHENKFIIIWSRFSNVGISLGKTGYRILSNLCWISRLFLAENKFCETFNLLDEEQRHLLVRSSLNLFSLVSKLMESKLLMMVIVYSQIHCIVLRRPISSERKEIIIKFNINKKIYNLILKIICA